jgi:hypothetical protein
MEEHANKGRIEALRELVKSRRNLFRHLKDFMHEAFRLEEVDEEIKKLQQARREKEMTVTSVERKSTRPIGVWCLFIALWAGVTSYEVLLLCAS